MKILVSCLKSLFRFLVSQPLWSHKVVAMLCVFPFYLNAFWYDYRLVKFYNGTENYAWLTLKDDWPQIVLLLIFALVVYVLPVIVTVLLGLFLATATVTHLSEYLDGTNAPMPSDTVIFFGIVALMFVALFTGFIRKRSLGGLEHVV